MEQLNWVNLARVYIDSVFLSMPSSKPQFTENYYLNYGSKLNLETSKS